MVATLNDHLDYFGTTVRVASLLPKVCRAGEVVLSQAVAAEPTVADLVQSRGLQCEVVPAEVYGLSEGFIARLSLSSRVNEVNAPRNRPERVALLGT